MCKSLVLKNMPLNESKHLQSLRIRYTAKILVLSPLTKEHHDTAKAHALHIITKYLEGTFIFRAGNLCQL